MRVLGLDWGGRRIGTAVSDERASIAFPLGFIERSSRKKDLAALKALIAEYEVSRIVVGLPIHMDGRRGPAADEALKFASALSAAMTTKCSLTSKKYRSRTRESLRPKPYVPSTL